MNKGTTRHPEYFCDKCGLKIRYTQRKGFIGLYTYAKREKNSIFKKEFDLCNKCEKRLQEWLKTKENECQENLLNNFPIWEEEK